MTIAPSVGDPVVAGASRYLGGPWGRHASARTWSWWTPVRLALALTVLFALFGFLQKSSCTTHPWSNDYQYTRVCYSDVFVLYTAEKLDGSARPAAQVGVPYRDHPVEYPAVIGGLMWAGAELTHLLVPDQPKTVAGGVVDDRARIFFDVSVLLLAACALLVTWSVARLAGAQRAWDAALVAAAPIMVLDGFINWDLAASALTCLGLYAWSRRRPAWAGVLLGLGTATKLYPALVLLAIGVLCLRAARLRQWLVAVGAAVAAFVAAYIPVLIVTGGRTFPFPGGDCPDNSPTAPWLFFWKYSQIRGADWGSPWLALRQLTGSSLDTVSCGQSPALLNLATALATIFVVAAVTLLAVVARQRPRVPQVAFLLVAGFVLVNKVDSPQYCLWLLPLAVLALPRWGPILVWQFTEVVLTAANFLVLAHQDNGSTGLPMWPYLTAMFVRDAALLWVMGLVVRDVLRPGEDVVRRRGADDPAGGVLDRAPDRWAPPRAVAAGLAACALAAPLAAAPPAVAAGCPVVMTYEFSASSGAELAPRSVTVDAGGCVTLSNSTIASVDFVVGTGYHRTVAAFSSTSYPATAAGTTQPVSASGASGSASGSIVIRSRPSASPSPRPTRSAPAAAPSTASTATPRPSTSAAGGASGSPVPSPPPTAATVPGPSPTRLPPLASGSSRTRPSPSPSPSPTTPAVAARLQPPGGRGTGLPAALAALAIVGTAAALLRVLLAEPTAVDSRDSVAAAP